jgi:hypothetical protein
MQEELLQNIVENTSQKDSFQIIVSDETTRFTKTFNPPIQLNKKKSYEMALVNLETYYSIPNITSKNNSFRYSPDGGVNWFVIAIPTGSYDIEDINDVIQRGMKANDHWDEANEEYYLSILANPNTMKAILNVENNYVVNFKSANSLRKLFGFNSKNYSASQESERVVDILSINSILVNIDLISGSYVNGIAQPTIYSFFPNVSPGHKIVENPQNLIYLPVTLDVIHSIQITLADQDGNQINLRGENVTIRFHIREK